MTQTDELGQSRLLVVGLGLIGGSLALAAKERGLCREVIGCSRSVETLAQALKNRVVDRVEADLATALGQLGAGDIVVICVPTLTVPNILQVVKDATSSEVTITDVASVKGSVVSSVEAIYGGVPAQFVPGHPIAGSEKSGINAVVADLYQHHEVILTPLEQTGADHLARVRALWQAVGAQVSEMPAEVHDKVLSATSHLPHLLAYTLVDTLADMEKNREIFRYAAGGFRDFTRIAGSDPVMWKDIALANDTAIVEVLDQLNTRLGDLRAAILRGDSDHLLGVFTRAGEARRHFQIMQDQKPYMSSTEQSMDYRVEPGGRMLGDIRVPGDKSISHRSIMLGAIAEGVTRVSHFLEGEDSLATLQAFRDMGVVIEGPDHGEVLIHGVGLHGLKPARGDVYLGNSGTSMRLLSGLMAGQAFDTTLTGDESLSRRPMRRVSVPLSEMGANIETGEGGVPPVKISGGQRLQGLDYAMPVASAQVKSSVLLAGLYAAGETSVVEPAPTRDHTERMLQGFQYPVKREGNRVSITGGHTLTACDIEVPGDISSAAFFMVAASIAPDSDLTLRAVGVNPTRIGVVNILRAMGANITLLNERDVGGEPVADIRVRYAPLQGIHIPEDQVPLAIDEFPAIFIAAACAEGLTVLTGAEELRVKESDRIQAMADGLVSLGVDASATDDGIHIVGGSIQGGKVDSLGDHRIAMSFAIAGLRAEGPIEIRDCNNVATSFPNFLELASTTGLALSEVTK